MELIARVEQEDRSSAEVLRQEMTGFRPRFIVNQVRSNGDVTVGHQLVSACSRHLGIRATYAGYVHYDDAVWQAVRRRKLFMADAPTSMAAEEIRQLTRGPRPGREPGLAVVDPEVGPLAAELAAYGTDASPLEAVLEAIPEPIPDAEPRLVAEPELRTGQEPGPSAMPGPTAFSHTPGGEVEPDEERPPWTTPSDETFYDALGVSPQASREQIEKAHRFCLEMYKEGALATYSLLEPGDAEAARRRIHLAFETLWDPERRREYDLRLGLIPTTADVLPVALAERSFSNQAPSSSSEAVLPVGPLLGADLRKVRESRGISLREIAVSSKIGLRFLEYIEEDRFDLLPPAVYLRGFLLEYARALGVDPRRMADAYMARIASR